MMEWGQIGEIAGILGGVATVLALILAPAFYLGSKIDTFRSEMESFKKDMKDEMVDFHSRLLILEERYLNLQEERNRGK